MMYLVLFILFVLLLWLGSALFMQGEDLSAYDHEPVDDHSRSFTAPAEPGEEHRQVVSLIEDFGLQALRLGRKQRLEFIRGFMDDMGRKKTHASDFTAVDADGVRGEWALAPGADPRRRVLYLHGGAFIAGSPASHRTMSDRFSVIANAAVLAIDYRLMPEHRRRDGIIDCRAAYTWLLDNGPDGEGAPDFLAVAGDSAGGNLALSLVKWARDGRLRLPDAVVAFSPTVDATFSSPSIVRNVRTDVMLGPMFSHLLRIPTAVRRWAYLLENRYNPASPIVSPVFGDLSRLPPTLIQVSEAEMLYDDARRFVNKARAGGSPAVLQSWGGMLHAWQIFYPELPEAGQAWEEVGSFLARAEADPESL
ncbi:MAG: alpha/beta hydrolase [Xanthomonadales bacterium]|nr:alpha/beta hydrolase [Xanthomonadales bacterium]